MRVYGLTPEDYDAMSARQNGVCAICRKKPDKRLCVDHSHRNNKVRDLLCGRCNSGLGYFDDDPALLRAAAEYLEEWRRLHEGQGLSAPNFDPPKISKINTERESDMTSNITTDDNKASRMMRKAILMELHYPPGSNDDPPADMLQQVARSLVQKAGQGDVAAIKEVLDRIDGKTIAAVPETEDRVTKVNMSWGKPT
jgi:hypothetical protein